MKYEITSYNTKKALAASLKYAMQKKSFSKITVSEIITDCGVNRKTFYYHFEDIYALLKWMFEEEAIEVVKHFDLMVDYEEAILFVIDYVEQNKHILNCAYDSIGREEMKRFLYTDFVELTGIIIEGAANRMQVTLTDTFKTYLTQFYTEALAGMLINWMKNRENYNKQEAVKTLSSILKYSIQGVLEHL